MATEAQSNRNSHYLQEPFETVLFSLAKKTLIKSLISSLENLQKLLGSFYKDIARNGRWPAYYKNIKRNQVMEE